MGTARGRGLRCRSFERGKQRSREWTVERVEVRLDSKRGFVVRDAASAAGVCSEHMDAGALEPLLEAARILRTWPAWQLQEEPVLERRGMLLCPHKRRHTHLRRLLGTGAPHVPRRTQNAPTYSRP